MPSRRALWLACALLVVSIPSYRAIPFGPFRGWDLENLFAFHRCGAPAAAGGGLARDDPYLVAGRDCGDSMGRPMAYPPLLYWSFAWVRFVPLALAVDVWAFAIAAGMLSLFFLWLADEPSARGSAAVRVFWILMLLQFPVTFSIERGNVDLLPVLAWSASFLLFQRGQFALAGSLAAAATLLKLYPGLSCVVVGTGLLGGASRTPRNALSFAAGMLAAVALACAPLAGQWQEYLLGVLPDFARQVPPAYVYSHSLPSLVGERRWIATAVGGALLAAWCAAAIRRLDREPGLVFAGALAISTYFAATSYDYNLITAYPLLLLQMVKAARGGRSLRDWGLLLLGLLAVIGHRSWFDRPWLYGPHVVLQVIWLGCSAVSLWRRPVAAAVAPG